MSFQFAYKKTLEANSGYIDFGFIAVVVVAEENIKAVVAEIADIAVDIVVIDSCLIVVDVVVVVGVVVVVVANAIEYDLYTGYHQTKDPSVDK